MFLGNEQTSVKLLLYTPFIRECFVLSLIEFGPVVLHGEDDLYISSMCFHYFAIISLLKSVALHLERIDSTLPKKTLCQV